MRKAAKLSALSLPGKDGGEGKGNGDGKGAHWGALSSCSGFLHAGVMRVNEGASLQWGQVVFSHQRKQNMMDTRSHARYESTTPN